MCLLYIAYLVSFYIAYSSDLTYLAYFVHIDCNVCLAYLVYRACFVYVDVRVYRVYLVDLVFVDYLT